MILGRNLLVGLTNSIWAAVVGLLAVPFYLKYLGTEAYGLIGFFVTTQTLLQVLDMGLTPAVNRETSQYLALKKINDARNFLHTLTAFYWGMAIIIGLFVVSISPLVAKYWLQNRDLSEQTILEALMLMGLVIACRWPIGLYTGVSIGAQRLAITSSINTFMITFGSFGAIGVVAYLSPTIQAFFMWQVIVSIVHVIIIRHAAWNILGRESKVIFDVGYIKSIWRFSAVMSGVAMSGLILMQLDKVILSKVLSLNEFGRYSLAVLAASMLYVLLTPMFHVVYPRMSNLFALGDFERLVSLYRNGTRLFSTIIFSITLFAIIFSKDLMGFWIDDIDTILVIYPVFSCFIVGTALNGVMHFPYALQLACGKVEISLLINVILVLIMFPLSILLSMNFGSIGGSVAWLVINGVYLFLGTWLTHKRLLKGIGVQWLINDVFFPLCISILIVGGGNILLDHYGISIYLKLFLSTIYILMSISVVMWYSSSLYKFVLVEFFELKKKVITDIVVK